MSTKASWSRLARIAIALSLVAASCGPAAATPTPLPTPGPAMIPFPVGTFVRDGEDPLGGHMVTYEADGSYLYQGHGSTAFGTYTVTGDQIVFKDNVCGGVLGVYTWSFDGTALTLKMLDDTCGPRPGVLHLARWERRP